VGSKKRQRCLISQREWPLKALDATGGDVEGDKKIEVGVKGGDHSHETKAVANLEGKRRLHKARGGG